VTGFQGEGGRLAAVTVSDRDGAEQTFHPAAAFVFIGLDPNTGFLGDGVARDAGGFLTTDDTWQTSLPGVFAAGDCRAGSTKQLASAVGDGIAALLAIRRHLERRSHLAPVLVDA
jgi:thioredoxin reductase (NADPH)